MLFVSKMWSILFNTLVNICADIWMAGQHACWTRGVYPPRLYNIDSFYCNAQINVAEGNLDLFFDIHLSDLWS